MTGDIIAIVAANEDWSDAQLVVLLLDFIERKGLDDELYDFLADVIHDVDAAA
jgi:hypothetical protein